VLGEHCATPRVDLDLPDDAHPGAFEPEVEPADPGAQAQDCELPRERSRWLAERRGRRGGVPRHGAPSERPGGDVGPASEARISAIAAARASSLAAFESP
jgi:hypothetical protein